MMNQKYVKLFQTTFLMLLLQGETLIVAYSSRDDNANIRCMEKERRALLEFKQGLVDDYGHLSSWQKNGDCCRWSGVQCNNKTGHVEMLDLANIGEQPLRGNISASLMDLHHLKYLDLSWNDFEEKRIPEFIGSLTNLRYLHLSYASFGKKIPSQLGQLSKLQVLLLSYNNLEGVIPWQLGNLSSLQKLGLSNNNLGGVIPYQLGNISSLMLLSLGDNAYLTIGDVSSTNAEWLSQLSSLKVLDFSGVASIPSKPKSWLQVVGQLLPKLDLLYLRNCNLSDMDLLMLSPSHLNSSDSLSGLYLSSNMFTSSIFNFLFNLSSNLADIELQHNLLEGPIPNDFGKVMKSLQDLSLYGNLLNGTIPTSLGVMSQLQFLELDGNHLEGIITDLQFANLTNLVSLSLSHNLFTVRFSDKWIPPFQLISLELQSCKVGQAFTKWLQTQKNLQTLDLSNVGISDTAKMVSFVCDASESLVFLNISNNHLTGNIPDCWSHLKSLRILDLSNNAFSGNIPTSIGSLVLARHIVLCNNRLVGKLPSLANCTDLVLLDVGGNKLSGTIPTWIGSNTHQLQVLSLRNNQFSGSLPSSLCHLTSIQVMDLSQNNLCGEIPKCIKNFSSMAQKRNFIRTIDAFYIFDKNGLPKYRIEYDFSPLVTWKGKQLSFKDNKRLLNLIDLSSNKLQGEIPIEIGNLEELISLDLSSNNLRSEIPSKFEKLQSLDYLNLSRNHLSGRIPSNLSKINRLSVLDLSNNNLSGKIPLGTQLQSFDASAYEGNAYLCGSPLTRSCPGDKTTNVPLVNMNREKDHEDYLYGQGFYLSMGLGFFSGFWGIFGSLLLFRSWRHIYFNFINNIKNKIFVMIMINVPRCFRWLNI